MVHQRPPRVKSALPFPSPSNLPPDTGIDDQPPVSPAYAVSSSSTYRPPSPAPRSRRPLVPDDIKKLQAPASVWNRIFASPLTLIMVFIISWLLIVFFWVKISSSADLYRRGETLGPNSYIRRGACPDYRDYSTRKHPPYSTGKYQLPFQRPAVDCRLFKSEAAEDLITQMTVRMADPDLARLFENCFPNTLDTTVRWHRDADRVEDKQSFIVTGDINAQWLRDSTNQLSQYQLLVTKDPALKSLILGAINTQVRLIAGRLWPKLL